jgi:hypothetical protein
MKKIGRIIENISLGLFVNGSYRIMSGTVTISNVYVVLASLYIMIMTYFILWRNKMNGEYIIVVFTTILAVITTYLALKSKREKHSH